VTSETSESRPGIQFRPLQPRTAEILRKVMTRIGVPSICTIKACRRSRRCSSAQVMCWQEQREELQDCVTLVMALAWEYWVAAGEPCDLSPATVEEYRRALARARSGAGGEGVLHARISGNAGEREPA